MYWDNAATGYIDYSYDAKGNLTRESLYNLPVSGAAELLTTTDYIFDNESNPYKATCKLMVPGINTNQNNITKMTYTIHLSSSVGPDNVQTTETAYEYNAKGYPISVNGNTTFVYN
jgi:YD repeat-containing protein